MKANEVLEKLRPVSSVSTKKVDRDPATKIIVTPDMVTMRPRKGARLLEVEKDSVSDLFRFLHIPPDMTGKIQPNTCGMVANDLLQKHDNFELLMRDGKIIGFRCATQHTGHALAAARVLETIEKVIEKPDYNRVIVGDSQSVSLEIVGIDKAPVTRGDVVRAGAMVRFSPLGLTNPSVQSFVLRLACTNGMTSNTVLREFSYGGGNGGGGQRGGGEGRDSVWSWLRKGLRDAYQSYGKVVERYQEMVNDEIPENQRAMMLEAMIKEAGLKDNVRDTVRAMAIENPIRTSYDVLNLITYATSHLLTDSKHITRARKAAEVFQSQDSHALFCPVCRKGRGQVPALPPGRTETTTDAS
ncbi:MAG: hypothetical protein PHO67_07875 [Candidatus Omnitrophica bacterium]|nr:hypothetical protein [Candidatus Omnitrophota bacterium]